MRRRARTLGPRSFRFVPLDELQGRPHVIVDGAPRPGTVTTLSHWPGTPADRRLWADVSAEIVLGAFGDVDEFVPSAVEAVSIDHFDVDAAISLALLVCEGLAEERGALLVDAAYVGDFDVVRGRHAMAVAFAVDALSGHGRDVAVARSLELLPALAADAGRALSLAEPQVRAFDASVALLDTGRVVIEEHPDIDLAVVRVEEGDPRLAEVAWAGAPVHPAAVHTATNCLRVATLAGGHYDVRFRYETWVRLASRRPRPRVDLAPLAARLGELEADGGLWRFDGAGAITPTLARADAKASTLEPERFLSLLAADLRLLDSGPPAWDPYDG